jgi:hypothetical protein
MAVVQMLKTVLGIFLSILKLGSHDCNTTLEKDYDTVEEAVGFFEREIGRRQGFLEALHKEDDWSFLIRSHASLEATFAHLLGALTQKQEEPGGCLFLFGIKQRKIG